MRVRLGVLTVALVAAGPAAAHADRPKACRPPLDASGDVRLGGDGPQVDAPHLDLQGAYLTTNRSYLGATIRTWGTRRGDGVWKMTFSIGQRRYYVVAARGVANPLDPDSQPGYRVGIDGGHWVEATGLQEANGFLIHAPWPDGERRNHARATGFEVVARGAGVSAAGRDVTFLDRSGAVRRC